MWHSCQHWLLSCYDIVGIIYNRRMLLPIISVQFRLIDLIRYLNRSGQVETHLLRCQSQLSLIVGFKCGDQIGLEILINVHTRLC